MDDFQLVTTGHSMGAAGAIYLALLLKRKYPQVRCFAFGTPGACVDKETSRLCQSFVTSVCLGSDIICRMSLRSLALLRTQILTAIARSKANKMQILQSLLKDYSVDELMHPSNNIPDSDFKRNLESFNRKMDNELKNYETNLQVAGKIIHLVKIRADGRCCGKQKQYVPVETFADEFDEIQVCDIISLLSH
jgi:sn1-specific diacylglycerol lipase